MALTPSKMLALGITAPDFRLDDAVSGGALALADARGAKGTLVMFICNHCPYVQHVNPELVRVANDYQPRGIGVVAISSNDVRAYPADAPEHMADMARAQGYPFPYLFDASQSVARAYEAACTPDFFLFDSQMKLAYRGRLDDSTPGNRRPLTGADLRAALDALLAGARPAAEQWPSVGCSIKWAKLA